MFSSSFFRRRPPADLVVVVEASIAEAKRLVALCESDGLAAVLGGKESCSSGGCSPKAAVLVPREDVPRFHALLQREWHASIAREGMIDPETVERLRAAAEDPEGGPYCPACGAQGEAVDGACGDCGLHFG